MKKLIISAIGQDKPGIVAAFTQVLFQNHCNVEDTSMTLLEDHFTMLFVIHAPVDLDDKTLEDRFAQALADFKLQMAIYPVEIGHETLETTGRPWMVSVSGKDQTGIIFHVTQYLASQHINIRHLSSKRLSRRDKETLFLMALEVDVPPSLTDETLHKDFANLASRENLEIHCEPMEVYTL